MIWDRACETQMVEEFVTSYLLGCVGVVAGSVAWVRGFSRPCRPLQSMTSDFSADTRDPLWSKGNVSQGV